jgi:DNA-binding MarR family transcriptional regulator
MPDAQESTTSTAGTPAKTASAGARTRSPQSSGTHLDEHCKRLLAAILEFSLLQRKQPPRQELQRQEASSGLGLDRAMQERGLGARHATALLSVALYGPLTVTQLAKRHHVTLKTASLIAVELEGAGLIERREDPADRRRTIVAIAKGKERAVDEGLKKRAIPLQRTLDRLTAAQREGLITGLEVLVEELS